MLVIRWTKARSWVEPSGIAGFRVVDFEADTEVVMQGALVLLAEAAVFAGAVSVSAKRWTVLGRRRASVTASWELPPRSRR